MNAIEEKLWEYIDGSCPAEVHQAISLLIEQDDTYRAKYLELLKLNSEFDALELEEPPMALTYKVMETIRADNAGTPLKAPVNNYIIRTITGFYLLIIAALTIFLLGNIKWSAVGSFHLPNLGTPNFSHYFKGTVLKAFLFFDSIVGLLLLDTRLRIKKHLKHI